MSECNMNIRYKCRLSTDVLAKAAEELNEPEDNVKRLAAIDLLRRTFESSSEGLQLYRSDDAFLLRFLRARKFDQERSLALLKNYHKQRVDWKDLFCKVNQPILLKDILEAGCVHGIPKAGRNGSSLIIGLPGKVKNMLLIDFVALLFVSIEKLLEDEEMQIHGLTVIHDMAYVDFRFATQMGPRVAKRFLGLMQECLPVRIKSINMINEPRIFDVVFSVVQPFLKEKTKQRLRVLGKDFPKLLDVIDPINLPLTYGGSAPELDPSAWKSRIIGEEESV